MPDQPHQVQPLHGAGKASLIALGCRRKAAGQRQGTPQHLVIIWQGKGQG
jgi:hypothetical protein